MNARFTDIKHRLRVLYRMTIKKQDGEYRVNFQSGKEATAYYTNDLEDAFSTAVHMRQRQQGVA